MLGHTEEAVKAELAQAGYDAHMIEEVYNFALSDQVVPATDIPVVTETGENNPSTKVVLPGVFALVSEGLAFVRQKFEVVLLLAVAMICMTVVDIVIDMEIVTTTAAAIGLFIVSLVAVVLYVIALTASLYVVSSGDKNPVSMPVAIRWARRNALSLIWLWLVSALVVGGGLLLFIIPGLIVMVHVALAQYVYVAEGKRGMAALVRSRDLIAGYWWSIAARLGGVSLVFMLGLICIGVLVGIVLYASGLSGSESMMRDSLTALVLQIIGAVVAVASMRIGFRLYEIMSAHRPLVANTPPSSKKGYMFLAVMSGLLIPISVLLAVVLATLNSAREMAAQSTFTQELSVVRLNAESYAASNVAGYSYRGFCATVAVEVIPGTIIDCLDDENFWLMSVRVPESNTEYCVGNEAAPMEGSIAVDGQTCEQKPDSKTRAADLRDMMQPREELR